jgi:peptidoglycan/xylan/chitin deacetylase (PgdA/CDA1 family)
MKQQKHGFKRVVLTCLALLGYLLLLPLWRRLRCLRRPEFRVLTYHSVSVTRCHETNVTPAAFARHMACLARHAHVHALADFVAGAAVPMEYSRPAVAITFDDGYADNLHEALPCLQHYGFAATCFAVVGLLDTEEYLPHDLDELPEARRMLTRAEARGLQAGGVTVGSHLLEHCRLAPLSDTEVVRQIESSRRELSELLARPVDLLAYPFGRVCDIDARAARGARAAGYAAAATAMYGWNAAGGDPFMLRRIGVESSDTSFTLRAKLNGALDLLTLFERRPVRQLIRGLNRLLRV